MLKSVSTLEICLLGYAALNAYARPGTAISTEAQSVTHAASALVNSAESSESLFGGKADAISRLRAIVSECGEDGWGGSEACAVDPLALQNAEDFLRALPEGISLPEFAPEPDGSISLDWIQSRHRLFSLSIGPGKRLAYAWLDGADKGHGVAAFDGFSIPSRIHSGIQSTLRHGNASIRAA
jgi:hypothetical protein